MTSRVAAQTTTVSCGAYACSRAAVLTTLPLTMPVPAVAGRRQVDDHVAGGQPDPGTDREPSGQEAPPQCLLDSQARRGPPPPRPPPGTGAGQRRTPP